MLSLRTTETSPTLVLSVDLQQMRSMPLQGPANILVLIAINPEPCSVPTQGTCRVSTALLGVCLESPKPRGIIVGCEICPNQPSISMNGNLPLLWQGNRPTGPHSLASWKFNCQAKIFVLYWVLTEHFPHLELDFWPISIQILKRDCESRYRKF